MNTTYLTPPAAILDFIRNHDKFFILGHNEPDGDCLGSQMGIAALLKKMGKNVSLYSPGPFRRPEIQEYEKLFAERFPAGSKIPGAVLIMDCSTLERIGDGLKEDIKDLPAGVIDHHAAGDDFGEVRWIAPEAPAVTLMVFKLFQTLGVPLDKEDADALFLGLATDTGYFRHLDENQEKAFVIASELVKAGTNPKAIFQKMNGGRTLESRILLGRLLARTQSHAKGKILVTYETLEEKRSFGPENRDSDILYQQLQGTRNTEVIILIREETEGTRSVGLRSLNYIDVGALAGRMGGGGHPRAAGFNTEKTRQEIVKELLEILTPETALLDN